MSEKPTTQYDDARLTGLTLAGSMAEQWASGRYASIAEVTSSVHARHPELPRSVVFWLAYHTLAGLPRVAPSQVSGSCAGDR